MLTLDYSDHRPLYEQIKEKLKKLIVSGALKENEKIPSVREFAAMLAINPNTIQRAYKDLETEGYIYSVRAKGSFIAPIPAASNAKQVASLREQFTSVVHELCYLGLAESELVRDIQTIYGERKASV